jgi:hypothetical protein
MATITRRKLEKVRGWVEKYRPILFLHQWTITVSADMPTIEDDDDDGATLASIAILSDYFNAEITLYPAFWSSDVTDTERERAILHELIHCLTEGVCRLTVDGKRPTYDRLAYARSESEQLTEWVTNIVWTLLGRRGRKLDS